MGGVQSSSGGLVLVKLGPRGAVARQLAMVRCPKYGGIWDRADRIAAMAMENW